MFNRLNQVRIGDGFGALQQDARLDQTAKAHADYVITNYFPNGVASDQLGIIQPDGWYTGHTEAQGVEGFTGTRPAARIAAAGYQAVNTGEVQDYDSCATPSALTPPWLHLSFRRFWPDKPSLSNFLFQVIMKINTAKSKRSLIGAQTDWQYSRPAILLHWVAALLVVFMVALGWYMTSIDDQPGSNWYFDLHKSVGLVFALLVVARGLWRMTHTPEKLPAALQAWQVKLAKWTQYLLYLLMVVVPLAGYLGASYSKQGVQLFGLSTPQWATPNHDLAEQFYGIHSVLVWLLIVLVALHVLGALKHLLLDKDAVFQRMWF